MLKKVTLDSEYIKMDGMLAIGRDCTQLQMLRLQCVNVYNKGLLVAIERQCKILRKITLSDSYYMGDHSLVAIARGCLQLEELEINYYHIIETVGLWTVDQSC
uniref:Uncharacterized protein n=2 Tax=Physcomitrium patens TaxID=3218 RepID=A0A7I4FSL8_PHYPA